jgi:hypothetical protein
MNGTVPEDGTRENNTAEQCLYGVCEAINKTVETVVKAAYADDKF